MLDDETRSDEPDWEYNPDEGFRVTRPFEDKFLLALIDANMSPPPEQSGDLLRWRTEREKRLAQAKKAISGIAPRSGPPDWDDNYALYVMAQAYHSDRAKAFILKGNPEAQFPTAYTGIRSERELARMAAQGVYGEATDAHVDRLRQKFSKNKAFWVEIGRSYDDLPETFDQQALEKLKAILEPFGVRMVIRGPWEALGKKS